MTSSAPAFSAAVRTPVTGGGGEQEHRSGRPLLPHVADHVEALAELSRDARCKSQITASKGSLSTRLSPSGAAVQISTLHPSPPK